MSLEKEKENYYGSSNSVHSKTEYVFNSLDESYKQRVYEKLGHGHVEDGEPIAEAEFMIQKIEELDIDKAVEILIESIDYHHNDPNFPLDDYELIKQLVKGAEENPDMLPEEWAFQVKMFAAFNEYFSPYPEVRAVSSPIDDPTTPVETIRAYFLGFVWTCIGCFLNEFFLHRQPSIEITSSVCQILILPCGRLLEKILPDWGFTLFGTRHLLNPGPWNMKEQMFLTIVFNVALGGIYVTSNIYVQKLEIFYNQKWVSWGYQVLLGLSTQTLGLSFAGILRKVCIYPTRAMWPTLLPTLALNQALLKPEHKEKINGWTISRYRFFSVAFVALALYFWFPDYIFGALSLFNWTTWIAPNNFNLAVVTGTVSGLGLNPVPTFDWNIIGYNYPLSTPFFSQANQVAGVVLAFFAILGVYYLNYKWSGYLPVNSNSVFDNTGTRYNVTKVLTGGLLDKEKYMKYSPPYYTAANLVLYGAFFAIYPFLFLYTCITEWKSVKSALLEMKGLFTSFRKLNFESFKDPHSRMMAKYKETPDWWFFVILAVSLMCLILCVKLYPVKTPVWGIFFTIGINLVFLIPITIIYSVTGFAFGLNVLVELIIGYAIPGNGNALMTLKAFGYNITGQAENFVTDQKMAHYAKIPPRAIFRGQLIAVIIQVFLSLGVVNWQMGAIKDICTRRQPQKFTCPGENVYYSSSVLWGVIGPARVFGPLYPILKYCFLIGALLAPICVAIKKFFPKQTKYFQPTLVIGGMLAYAPYNLLYYLPGLYVSYVFNKYIKERYSGWWQKYNYVLSSALNAGVAFAGIIIFFAVQYKDVELDWWGNNVPYAGVDGGNGRPSLLDPVDAPDGYFGLRYGSFS